MFKDTLGKLKPDVKFTAESWAPFGTTDFRPHINTILDAKPEGLYSVVWAGELITLIKQAKQAGLFDKIKHVMLPVGAAMDVLEGLGPEMPDNICDHPADIFSSIQKLTGIRNLSRVSINDGITIPLMFQKPVIPQCMRSRKR